MKLLVFSDSHNSTLNMETVLKKASANIEAVLYLGDCVEDIVRLKEYMGSKELYYVTGNCDYWESEPAEAVININGKRIFMCHGHYYKVKYGVNTVIYAALENQADICLFGHTHCPFYGRSGDLIILNPGSISLPRGYRNPTYGILNIDGDKTAGSIWEINQGFLRPADLSSQHMF